MVGLRSIRFMFGLLGSLLLAACSGVGVGGGGLMPPGSPGDTSGSSSGIDSDSGESDASGTTPDTGGAPDDAGVKFPVGSIPLPSLRSSSLIAYAPDAQNYDAVVGFAGAAPYDDGHQVVVSLETIEAQYQPDIQINSPLSSLRKLVIPEAHALSPASPDDICYEEGRACCPINPDGSFECGIELVDESVTEVHVAVLDADGNMSLPTTEEIQSDALYLKAVPESVGMAQGAAYSLGDGKVAAIKKDGKDFRVMGDHSDNYAFMDSDAVDLAYDTIRNLLALQNDTDLELMSVAPITSNELPQITGSTTIPVPAGETITQMKYTAGKISYVTGKNNPDTIGKIVRIAGMNESPELVRYFWQNTAQGITWKWKSSIVFDVDVQEYGLAIYEDDAGLLHLRLGRYDTPFTARPFADVVLRDINKLSLRDLKIYRQNSVVSNQPQRGLALLLDETSSRVGVVSFNRLNQVNFSVNIDQWLSLGVNKNPQSFVLNGANTRAYVLNQGDETITVLKLDASTGMPTIAGLLKIKDRSSLSKKDIKILPTEFAYQKSNQVGAPDQLLIGSEGIKGLVVMDVPSL